MLGVTPLFLNRWVGHLSSLGLCALSRWIAFSLILSLVSKAAADFPDFSSILRCYSCVPLSIQGFMKNREGKKRLLCDVKSFAGHSDWRKTVQGVESRFLPLLWVVSSALKTRFSLFSMMLEKERKKCCVSETKSRWCDDRLILLQLEQLPRAPRSIRLAPLFRATCSDFLRLFRSNFLEGRMWRKVVCDREWFRDRDLCLPKTEKPQRVSVLSFCSVARHKHCGV